jgi:hypothetical protein
MPLFVAALLGGLVNIAATLAGRVLLSLGFGVVAYSGLSVTFDYLRDQALTRISALDPVIVSMLSYMKVGVALNIIISALLVRLTLQGLSSGVIKRLVMQ